jgi:hypothetical protein
LRFNEGYKENQKRFHLFFFLLLSPMRKNIISISLILSFLMVVIHEMIPHHHHEMDEDIELLSHQQQSGKHSGHSETGNTTHFPFPAHHHLTASEEFNLTRIGTGFERNDISPSSVLIPGYLLRIPDAEPPESTFYPLIPIPYSSYPFIISPDAMRGSPSAA